MGTRELGRKVHDQAEAEELLCEWEHSDEPVSDWCRARGINWRSLVAYRGVPSPTPRVVELTPQSPARSGLYRIVLGGDISVEVDDHFQEATLGRLLRVLAPC